MPEKKYPHEVTKNPANDGALNFERDVLMQFQNLKTHFVKEHYTFTQKELIAILRSNDDGFEVNAISFFPVIEDNTLQIYAIGVNWTGNEEDAPTLPGGGGDGPPVLKTGYSDSGNNNGGGEG